MGEDRGDILERNIVERKKSSCCCGGILFAFCFVFVILMYFVKSNECMDAFDGVRRRIECLWKRISLLFSVHFLRARCDPIF